jgi:hypothetical protein
MVGNLTKTQKNQGTEVIQKSLTSARKSANAEKTSGTSAEENDNLKTK